MRLSAIAVVVGVLALAGCGQTTGSSSSSKDFNAEQQKVADKIGDLSTDGSRNKPADICDDVVTADLRSKIAAGGSDCAAEMKKAIEDADAFDLDVKDVTITGDTAKARVSTKDHKKDVVRTFTLSRQGSSWRISDFG
jgi:hypothetical protein